MSPTDRPTLKIAFCLPERSWIEQMGGAQPADAAALLLGYQADGLCRLGHSLTYFAPDGPERLAYGQSGEQLKHSPQTWSAQPWFEGAASLAWRGQQLLGVPYLNVFSNYRYSDAFQRSLPGHDLIYERNALYNAGAGRAARKLGLPYVVFFDADQIQELEFRGQPLPPWLRRRAGQLLRANLRAAQGVITVSAASKANLVARWGVPEQKVLVFPNGVDITRFQPQIALRGPVRQELGVGSGPLIAFVGNFYEWHDVEGLLAAFAQVLAARPDARLALTGDGPQRAAMARRAEELGLASAVRFTGRLPHAQVARILAAADIAVAPAPAVAGEMWLSPMKLFEYLACGLAVIASRVGQMAEVVRDGQNGLLVPPGEAPALAAALLRLIDDPALRSSLGRQARQDAVANHSWEQYSARLEQVFRAVIAKEPVSGL